MTSWPGDSQDTNAEALRRGLQAARARTGDEIARRRLWARVAEPGTASPPRRRWAVAAMLGFALVVLGVGTGAFVWTSGTADRTAPPLVASAVDHAGRPNIFPVTPSPPASLVDLPMRVLGPAQIRTTARQRQRVVLRSGALVDLAANSFLQVDDRDAPVVKSGRIVLEVPKQPPGQRFTVAAGEYLIAVIGTKFAVRVAGSSVGVDVEEGVVEVWKGNKKVSLHAGDAWTSPSSEPRTSEPRIKPAADRSPGSIAQAPGGHSLADAHSAPAQTEVPANPAEPELSPFRQAELAMGNAEPYRALQILADVARGQGPSAENAAYQVGRIMRDQLSRPRDAIQTWGRYRERFPAGLLRAETDISILETLVSLGDRAGALVEADAFLRRHPGSERRAEVGKIAQRLRQEGGLSAEGTPHPL